MINKTTLKKLFNKREKSPLLFSSIILFLGTYIFILSLFFLSFIDRSVYLKKDDSHFILSKNISFLNTFKKDLAYFSNQDIADLLSAPGINRVDKIYISEFPCRIIVAGNINYYSEIFLEGIDNKFLSVDTSSFHWKNNDESIPLIISKEFLQLYNYSFVRSNNLPILTESTAKLLPLTLQVNSYEGGTYHKAHIHGFSDRYLSILAPVEFINWANNQYNTKKSSNQGSTKVVVEVEKEQGKSFLEFTEKYNYVVHHNKSSISENIKVANLMIFFFLILGFVLVIASQFLLFYANKMALLQEKDSIIKLTYIGYSFKKIKSVLFQKTFIIILTSLVTAIICSIITIYYIMDFFEGVIQFNFHEIRMLAVLIIVTCFTIAISFYSNKKLKFINME